MDTAELEIMLSATAESQSLDFKADCAWSTHAFAKDILAFSNVQDGGYLVIGVQDKTLLRIGVSPKNVKSYDIDTMKDQMTSFADPNVQFEVYLPKDNEDIQFVVIKVFPFKEIPVICRKDDPKAGVNPGKLYYRNSNRRIESAPISNSTDLRNVIERATVQMMRKYGALGLIVDESIKGEQVKNKLDNELGGL